MRPWIIVGTVSSIMAVLTMAGCAGADAGGHVETGGGSAGVAAPFIPPTRSPAPATAGVPQCVAGDAQVGVESAKPPAPVCLRVGHQLRIVTGPSPHQPWEAVTSTDSQTMACTSNRAPDGVIVAACRAVRPGTAVVATGTMPFAGDPHGPAQQFWQLSVTVKA